MADSQAERNQAGPSRTLAGRLCQCVARSSSKSPTAVAVSMVANSLAHQEEELDAAAAADDAKGEQISCSARAGCGCLFGSAGLYRLGKLGPIEGPYLARSSARSQFRGRARDRQGDGAISSLARSTPSRSPCTRRRGKRATQATARHT